MSARPQAALALCLLVTAACEPTATPTQAPTATPAPGTGSPSPSGAEPTPTGAPTATPTAAPPTGQVTLTPSPTAAPTAGGTPTATPVSTTPPGGTLTPTATPSATLTPTATPVSTTPPGGTLTPTATPSATQTPTATPVSTTPPGGTHTPTATPSAAQTPTSTPVSTTPPGGTHTPTATLSATEEPSATPTQTQTPSATPTGPTELGGDVGAWRITRGADLMQGLHVSGRLGDIMLANDLVRIIVQKPRRDIGWGLFGGNVVDAALVEDGQIGGDLFGELSPFINLGYGIDARSVEIVDDGSGGAAVVVAEGPADLFDILQLEEAAEDIGLPLPYDLNAPLPIWARTTYTLLPGERRLRVETELFNTSDEDLHMPVGDLTLGAGDVEIYAPNPTGKVYQVTLDGQTTSYTWGGFEKSAYSATHFVGFYGENGAVGYMPPPTAGGNPDSMSVHISGVTVSVIGTTSALDVFLKVDRNLFEVPAGGSNTYQRDLYFGSDIGKITDQVYAARGVELGTLTGVVTDQDGAPLAGVRLGVVTNGEVDSPVTAMTTGQDGRFEVGLPPGDYGLIGAQGADFAAVGREGVYVASELFNVRVGRVTTHDLELPAIGQIAVDVVDELGLPSPARVLVYGPYQAPPPAVMDTSDDRLSAGVARIVWLEHGQGTFDMPPGTWDLVISRGMEYDLTELEQVQVSSGGVTHVEATLTRVLDTAGYLSADLHVHGHNSPDSSSAPLDRVRTFVTEGVEILVSTDHGHVMDYAPAVSALASEDQIISVVGVETTPFALGHFNVFPLVPDPDAPNGGALDHADADYRPLDLSTGLPVDLGLPEGLPSEQDGLTSWQIFKAYELSQPGTQVRQVNHARGDLGGHFTVIGMDLSKAGTPQITSEPPSKFRIYDETELFDPSWMSAMEIANATSLPKALTLMNDWFGLLNLGYRITGTGVSDTHNRVGSEGGYARTYVALEHNDPIEAHLDPDFNEAMATAINGQQATIASGIYLTAEVEGRGGETVTHGGTVAATEAGSARLHIRAQAPEWTSVETVAVYINPVVTANVGQLSFAYLEDLDPAFMLQPDAGLASTVVHMGGDERGPFRTEYVGTLDVSIPEDAWVVVMAIGPSGGLRPAVDTNNRPFAITNPIFVDADGDGEWTPPGAAWVLPPVLPEGRQMPSAGPACSHGHNPVEVWKALVDAGR